VTVAPAAGNALNVTVPKSVVVACANAVPIADAIKNMMSNADDAMRAGRRE
jgi:hypothetical protein